MPDRRSQRSGKKRARAVSPSPRPARSPSDANGTEPPRTHREPSTLNGSQQRFVDEYLVDQNGARAYATAYPDVSPKAAESGASRLLRNAKVAAAIAERRAVLSEKAGITQERVVQEFAAVAFATLRDVVQWGPNGLTVTPSDELSSEAAAAVQQVEMTETEIPTQGGAPIVTRRMKVKMHPKLEALMGIVKVLGLAKDEGVHASAGVQIFIGGGPTGLEVQVMAGAEVKGGASHSATVELGGEAANPLPPSDRPREQRR